MISELIGWFRNIIGQWRVNISATAEFKGYIEASIVRNELKRIEAKLTGRLDTLEEVIDDVMEKYLRKVTARERREAKAQEGEEQSIVTDPYEEIRRRHEG